LAVTRNGVGAGVAPGKPGLFKIFFATLQFFSAVFAVIF
jgi:hypothetical protein